MAIKYIVINNILTFNGEFKLNFSDGINVLIGENGTGKTSLLKLIYAATQYSHEYKVPFFASEYFTSGQLIGDSIMVNSSCMDKAFGYNISDGTHTFKIISDYGIKMHSDNWFWENIKAVFIPSSEMLSHSNGFLALNQKYRLPFDKTQIDIIVNASLPEAREIPDYAHKILEKIGNVIDGEIIQENDTFYVLKNNGSKMEFSFEAEGFRKLGLIWKLIRNGLIEKDSILLWDEPETNLNPELFPLVAEILLELQRNGVQIFVATHTYDFAKYLEIRRDKESQVLFHNLRKDKDSDTILAQSDTDLERLSPDFMIANDRLLDEIFG